MGKKKTSKKVFPGQFKELKEDGTGTAVFSTLNVVDKDGDITVPGAFTEQTVKLVGGHDWGSPNIGMARIKEVGDTAVADFKFYLDMESAKEWYKSVWNNHKNKVPQEYSYGFNVKREDKREVNGKQVRGLLELEVIEVSFVMAGAGEGTQTLDVKCESCSAKEFDKQVSPDHPTESGAATSNDDSAPDSPSSKDDKAQDGVGKKGMYLPAFDGSWEDAQSKLHKAARLRFMGDPDDTDNGMDGWVSVEATFSDKAYVHVEDYKEKDSKYYELDWTMNDAGDLFIVGQREIEFDVAVRTKSVDQSKVHLQRVVRDAKRAFEVYKKEGRTLSTANRTRLAGIADSLDNLGKIRDSVVTDIRSFLEETDPDREPDKQSHAVLDAIAAAHAAMGESTLALARQ